MNKKEFGIIKTTFKTEEEASALARVLLQNKLIASAQIKEMKSMYMWKGVFNHHKEFELNCFCLSANFQEIEDCIKAYHSYELPEIISIAIENISKDFALWIEESL